MTMTAEENRKREHARLKEGMRQVMSTPEGRSLLRHILGKCRVLRADFVSDSGSMYYMEGQRSVGLHILELAQEENTANVAALLQEDGYGG